MDNTNLQEIIESHGKWLRGEEGGRRADLCKADLCKANLSGADLSNADLSGADLSNADLRRADLRGADLSRANLYGAYLRNAYLCDADLRNADLNCANLRNANLCDADLYCADLRGADLSRADLSRADLSGADLSRADLPTKIITVGPIGSRQSYTIYRVDENIVQCGCWHGEGREPWKGGTLEEFEERVIAAYPLDTQHGKDYRAVVEYFKTLKIEVGSHE